MVSDSAWQALWAFYDAVVRESPEAWSVPSTRRDLLLRALAEDGLAADATALEALPLHKVAVSREAFEEGTIENSTI